MMDAIFALGMLLVVFVMTGVIAAMTYMEYIEFRDKRKGSK